VDVYFDFDEAILTKEAQVILKRSVQILKKNLKLKSVLQGIPLLPALTRTTKGCSERRSNAVNEYLTKEGVIAPNRLSTRSALCFRIKSG
jgi:outer membrane protein OmpA-like peptidoglycan-associated protein